jgi:hypothetical protein
MVCSGVSVLVRVVITITVDTKCATEKWNDFQMGRGGEGVAEAQVVWRTGVAESGKFFGREGAVGGRNQSHGSADLCVRRLGVHPRTPAPMGSQSAWTGNPNPLTHRHPAARVQNQRRGSADHRGDRPPGLSVRFVRRGRPFGSPFRHSEDFTAVLLLQATLTKRLTSLFHIRPLSTTPRHRRDEHAPPSAGVVPRRKTLPWSHRADIVPGGGGGGDGW